MAKSYRRMFILLMMTMLFIVPLLAQGADVTTTVNTPITLTLTAPEGAAEPLTFIIDALPINGQIAGEAPHLEYMPNTDYVGADAITYTVVDGAGNVTTSTLTIDVQPDAQAIASPTPAENGDGDPREDTPLSPSGQVDTEPLLQVTQGDPLEFELEAGTAYEIITEPQFGVLSGQVPLLTYEPEAEFEGIDSFVYAVTVDGEPYEITVYFRVGEPVSLGALPRSTRPVVEGLSAELAAIVTSDNLNALRQTGDLSIQRALEFVDGNLVEVTIRTNGDVVQAQALIEGAGGIIIGVINPYIIAEVPLSALESLGASEVILHIEIPPELEPLQDEGLEPQVGNVNTQGLISSNANVWHAANIRGQGIRIGVLDDGFDNINATETPCLQEVLDSEGVPYSGGGGSHGTAVVEIVCDMAPYSEVYALQAENASLFYNAVQYLINDKQVDVITASLGTPLLAGDGSDIFSLIVDQATASGDVVFAVASGNNHSGHYEAPYTPMNVQLGGQIRKVHDFDSGVAQDWGNNRVAGNTICKRLIWDDWAGDVTIDFDLVLYWNNNGNWQPYSTGVESSGPHEDLCVNIPTNGEFVLVIVEIVPPPPGRSVWLQLVNNRDGVQWQHWYDYSSITSPGTAQSAFSVGAANWSTGDLRSYSGHGPANTRTTEGGTNPFAPPGGYFHPRITGPTDVNTYAWAVSHGGDLFNGTSAATPHVAGAAALVRNAYPDYTRTDTENFLINRASLSPLDSDPGILGPDSAYGYGYLWLGPAPSTCGIDTVAIYRDSDRNWYLRYENEEGYANANFPYGSPSDVAISGDWNGDGVDTVGIYRDGRFYLKNSNTAGHAEIEFTFGATTDIPVAGDWNGDGIDTIGVYRPSTGMWYMKNTHSGGTSDIVFRYGLTNEIPVAGDWDGDGVDTIGIFRGSDRRWYLKNSNAGGAADIVFLYGNPATDVPVVGDWNADCADTIGIYRTATGRWYLKNSNSDGPADFDFRFGIPYETPMTGRWIP